jgi:hypothetical protein
MYLIDSLLYAMILRRYNLGLIKEPFAGSPDTASRLPAKILSMFSDSSV